MVLSGYGLVTGGYRWVWGCQGVDLGGSVLVMSVFLGGCELVFSGHQWLGPVMGCFWVVIGCNGRL